MPCETDTLLGTSGLPFNGSDDGATLPSSLYWYFGSCQVTSLFRGVNKGGQHRERLIVELNFCGF